MSSSTPGIWRTTGAGMTVTRARAADRRRRSVAVARNTAMDFVGHKTEGIYRRR
jgi:hypothetical protein